MGEYAKFKGSEIKIGTCESMYYLTLSDRNKISNYYFDLKKFWVWRLPQIGDYKDPGDGEYEDWKKENKTIINDSRFWEMAKKDIGEKKLDEIKGILQMRHDCGYLVNLPCYHGRRLPNISGDDCKIFWNGKSSYMMRISGIRTKGEEIAIEISCKVCGRSFSVNKEELKYLMQTERNGKNEWLYGEETQKYYELILKEIEDYENEIKTIL